MRLRLLVVLVLLLWTAGALAQECSALQVQFFYSKTCPHCQNEKPLLEKIDRLCEEVDVSFYEISQESTQWERTAKQYNVSPSGVPLTFVGDRAFIGFSEHSGPLETDAISGAYIGYQNQILAAIEEKVHSEHCDIMAIATKKSGYVPALILLVPLAYLLSYFAFRQKIRASGKMRVWYAGLFATVILAFFGLALSVPDTVIKDFAQSTPFPAFVFIVALADGFNPCAFTVLIILLSLLTYTRRRRDMLLIGLIFILTSALMYMAFILTMIIAGSFALEKWGSSILFWLGIAILGAGAINLKDFFWFKKGVSLTISEKHRERIMQKAGRIARGIRSGQSGVLAGAVLATFMLAVFVNLVELGCTAILPTVFMASLLKSFGVEIGFAHVFWTAAYSLIYIIPLLAILANFVYTFRSARLTERQGRILKLAAGIFMIIFGMVMIFNPGVLMFG